MSFLRLLPKRWQRRIRDYAPRGFADPNSCGAFYDARTRLFRGDEAAALEYSSLAYQQGLFDRAADALPPHGRVLDVGCGLAHLLSYLEDRRLPFGVYCGIDVSASMLDLAAARIGERPDVELELRNLVDAPLPRDSHDVAYIISVLGYPIGKDPMSTMMSILKRTFDACTDGIVFTHIADGRCDRPFAFPTVPTALAERCEKELEADATIHDDDSDFTYLISLRRR